MLLWSLIDLLLFLFYSRYPPSPTSTAPPSDCLLRAARLDLWRLQGLHRLWWESQWERQVGGPAGLWVLWSGHSLLLSWSTTSGEAQGELVIIQLYLFYFYFSPTHTCSGVELWWLSDSKAHEASGQRQEVQSWGGGPCQEDGCQVVLCKPVHARLSWLGQSWGSGTGFCRSSV